MQDIFLFSKMGLFKFHSREDLGSRLKNLFDLYTYTVYNQYLWSTNYIILNTHYNYILIYN
jgi:hypothetical protein